MAQDTRKKDSQGTGSADRGKRRQKSKDIGDERGPHGGSGGGQGNRQNREVNESGSGGGTPPEKYQLSRDQATHGVEDKHGEKRNTM